MLLFFLQYKLSIIAINASFDNLTMFCLSSECQHQNHILPQKKTISIWLAIRLLNNIVNTKTTLFWPRLYLQGSFVKLWYCLLLHRLPLFFILLLFCYNTVVCPCLPSLLFDVVCVLLHGDFLHGALKAKEMLDVQTGILLKTCPARVLWVNLQHKTKQI